MTLEKLVTGLTTSGSETLDAAKLRELKQICKNDSTGKAAISEAFALLLAALHKTHAQIRVSALQAINAVFERSHAFRLLVIGSLPQILALTMGAYQKSLPPPVGHARRLRALGAECLYAWVQRFGFAYQRLVYALRFMRFTERVDFRAAARAFKARDPARVAQRRRMAAASRREYMRRTVGAVVADFADRKREVARNIACLDNCFEMLVPDLADMFGSGEDKGGGGRKEPGGELSRASDDEDIDDEDIDNEVLAVMAANRHAIHIEFDPEKVLDVEETGENAAVYDAIRDCMKMCVRRHQPMIDGWIARLDQVDDGLDTSVAETKTEVRQLKTRMLNTMSKCKDFGVDLSFLEAEDGGSSDDDFEDVPVGVVRKRGGRREEGPAQTKHKRKQNAVFSLLGESGLEADPTVVDPKILRYSSAKKSGPRKDVASTANNNNNNNSANSSHVDDAGKSSQLSAIEDRLRESAPVVRYDTDLMYWSSDAINANTTGLEIRHRFLGSANEDPIVSDEAARRLRMRAVYLKDLHSHSSPGGKDNADGRRIKACRAPMRSGKLCPRRDLVKCPFHGPVVPRDELGRPQGPAGDTDAAAHEQQPQSAEGTEAESANVAANSVATAETMDDLRAEDVEQLVANKYQPDKAAGARKRQKKTGGSNSGGRGGRSGLVNIRKKQPAGVKHLRKLVKKYYK
ncbi:hypothetical protein GGH99_006430 [Coemansia sp. RSA 1285]|nr:hypothetical protein GGH99_006430 [Coemansia sp. RSA 1285]